MNIQFKPAEYAESLSQVAMIRTEALPDVPISKAELREQQRLRPSGLFRHFELIEADGELAGFWMLQQEPMFVNPGEMHLRCLIREAYQNRGIECEAVAKGIALAKQQNLTKVVALARTTHPGFSSALADAGFRAFHRDIISSLDLSRFCPDNWQAELSRISDQGIRIRCAKELESDNPSWIEQAYQVHIKLMQDVPFASHYTAPAFETWASKVRNPNLYDLSLMFFAFDNGTIVGETTLFRYDRKPELCLTGLTAVVREWRRRGIALALKIHSISFAKAHGIERIDTGNEEDNPAYLMNRKLGYKDLYQDVGYELAI